MPETIIKIPNFENMSNNSIRTIYSNRIGTAPPITPNTRSTLIRRLTRTYGNTNQQRNIHRSRRQQVARAERANRRSKRHTNNRNHDQHREQNIINHPENPGLRRGVRFIAGKKKKRKSQKRRSLKNK